MADPYPHIRGFERTDRAERRSPRLCSIYFKDLSQAIELPFQNKRESMQEALYNQCQL